MNNGGNKMNEAYAEDALVRPESIGPIETDDDEVRLLTYLGELADGTRWIYNESNRIVEAAGLALNLIREKNRRLWSRDRNPQRGTMPSGGMPMITVIGPVMRAA